MVLGPNPVGKISISESGGLPKYIYINEQNLKIYSEIEDVSSEVQMKLT